MTKIETFTKSRAAALRIANNVSCALGKNSTNNDKHHISVKFCGMVNSNWSPMKFQIEARHGYYGSSSGYSDTGEDLGRFLAKAMNEYKEKIFVRAAELADEEAETYRLLAVEEANSVLQKAEVS